MSAFAAIALLAAAASSGAQSSPPFTPTKAVAPAVASVRILQGAKIQLSEQAAADGHKLNKAVITVEDGSRRPAKLVEFQ